MTAGLGWTHTISEIPENGLATEREASRDERAEIAAALDLIDLARLAVRYEVKPLTQGRYLLEGTLEANVAQRCVVTLEPVEARIAEPFEIEFRPGDGAWQEPHFDPMERRDFEPLAGGMIPVGRVVYELLASALDPYPRRDDAVLDKSAAGGGGDAGRDNPFAALKALKTKL